MKELVRQLDEVLNEANSDRLFRQRRHAHVLSC